MDARRTTRELPAVDRVLRTLPPAGPGGHGASRAALVRAVREAIADLRREVLAGRDPGGAALAPEAVAAEALRRVATAAAGSLRTVVNLTGVVIHTNLGRSPLSRQVLAETADLLAGYTNLEYDVPARRRGSRNDHVASLLLRIVPAEAAFLVNNNAAAVLLALAELARGREVVVSRGELVEIGGAFRIPDVMAASGARLVEVGTTNRTRIADYERAIGPDTAMLFKAHRSNFRMEGFVEDASWEEVAALARGRGLSSVADLGSGMLANLPVPGAADEPSPAAIVRAGFDVVCFSGDKMLGGPQAGVVVGRADAVARMKRHPLARALRVGSFTIAAMEATLRRYLAGGLDEVPAVAALRAPASEVKARCARIVRRARSSGLPAGLALRVVSVAAEVGGGALPGHGIPSHGVEVRVDGASDAAVDAALRAGDPPILGRLTEGRVVLDPRTLLPGQEDVVVRALLGLPAVVAEMARDKGD
jgi:L-seryl-tRNA(Ser) seleniumtransferase